MERMTELICEENMYESKFVYPIDDAYCGEAIQKLAKFENLFDHLMMLHDDLPRELEKLRNEGKSKSYRFRELFSKKLTVEIFLELMKDFDIE